VRLLGHAGRPHHQLCLSQRDRVGGGHDAHPALRGGPGSRWVAPTACRRLPRHGPSAMRTQPATSCLSASGCSRQPSARRGLSSHSHCMHVLAATSAACRGLAGHRRGAVCRHARGHGCPGRHSHPQSRWAAAAAGGSASLPPRQPSAATPQNRTAALLQALQAALQARVDKHTHAGYLPRLLAGGAPEMLSVLLEGESLFNVGGGLHQCMSRRQLRPCQAACGGSPA
jgi:hypothetical protein